MALRIASVPKRVVRRAGPPTTTTLGLPGLGEIVVLALASSRLTRAIALDEITAPARDRLESKAEGGNAVWVWASRLLSCPACVGWWVSLAISATLPGRRRLLRGLSVAGAQILLALLERLISEEGREAISSADVAEVVASDVKAAPPDDQSR